MIDFNVIDILIYTWVNTFSGISVTWQNQKKAPKLDLPFMAIRRQSIISKDQGYISNPDNSGIGKISSNRDMIINCQCYGSNAFGRLEDLYNVRLLDSSFDLLRAGGLSLIDQIVITDLTGLNDLEYEERATTDLLFRFASQNDNVSLGLIETINIENNLKEPDKTKNFDIDLT